MLNSPNSLCPLSLAMRGESWTIYEAFIKSISDQHGFEDLTENEIQHSFFDAKIVRTLICCDAKAGQMIYGCSRANTREDWCMWGCEVNKSRYDAPSVLIYSSSYVDIAPDYQFKTQKVRFMPDRLDYIMCTLHCRIRLVGHMLVYCVHRINSYRDVKKKAMLLSRMQDELDRCHVLRSLLKVPDSLSATIDVFDPSGDAVDNLCRYGFNILCIFGMYCICATMIVLSWCRRMQR